MAKILLVMFATVLMFSGSYQNSWAIKSGEPVVTPLDPETLKYWEERKNQSVEMRNTIKKELKTKRRELKHKRRLR